MTDGFDGEKIFKLDNGQIWQQATYKYRYRYKHRPKVSIWKDAGSFYIEIEGINEKVKVRRA